MKRIFPSLILFALVGCHNDDETPACHVTPGRMELDVNGIHISSSDVLLPNVNYNPNSGRIDINVYFGANGLQAYHVNLGIEKAKVGTFDIPGGGFQASANSAYYVTADYSVFDSFYVDQLKVGKITVTEFDLTKKVISGSFEVTVAQDFNKNIQTLTSGCFAELPVD
ncbi:MAG: DUF6252 family protein [Cyclobacteriaceae bacterium]|nr:DUF6252 family protein [Cyclobacteriaceae bacterium]MDH5251489.1 DUF6252 family protein [Cyclobacteriaceae bacterium]